MAEPEVTFMFSEGAEPSPFGNSRRKEKKKKKKGGGLAGYKSATEGNVTASDIATADMLAGDGEMLRAKLRDKIFIDACYLRGVEPNALMPKTINDFRTAPDRALVLSPEEQQMRYQSFENNRRQLLALVVSQEAASREKQKRDKKKNAERYSKLSGTFQTKLAKEQEMLQRMKLARSKYERVLETENTLINETLRDSATKQLSETARTENIRTMKSRIKNQLKHKAAERSKRIASRVQARRDEEENWKRMQRMKMEAKQKKVNRYLDAKTSNHSVLSKKKKQAEAKRKLRRAQAKEREEAERRRLLSKLDSKGDTVQRLKEQKAAKRERLKVQKQLKSQQRQEKAERVRRAKAYEKQKLINKMEANYARMEAMKQMKQAIEQKRRDLLRQEKIRRDEWKLRTAVERSVTPGPGAYAVPSTLKKSGGAWGKFRPQTELDIIIARAKSMPAPGEYGIGTGSTLSPSGGSWSMYKPKSDVEWAMERASKTPGPGEYQPKLVSATTTASFGNFTPKSELDLVILRAAESPAPGQYQPVNVPKRKKKLAELQKEFQVSTKAVMFAAKLRSKLRKKGRRPQSSTKS